MTQSTQAAPARGLILGLLAETHIHPGAGQSEGAIDLPVARERTTDYPFVPGSGVKGAVKDRERAIVKSKEELEPIYGKADEAGALVFSDARLLLLPVRSLSTAYVWLTCPHLVERFRRDHARLFRVNPPGKMPEVKNDGEVLRTTAKPDEKLFLEEHLLSARQEQDPAAIGDVATLAEALIADADARSRVREQLAIVSDRTFAWFARWALPVMAHNKLYDEKRPPEEQRKTSQGLWYEETLAPDTVLYTLVHSRNGGGLGHVTTMFADPAWLQLGGNETVGQGWLQVKTLDTAITAAAIRGKAR
jgi:CRISPR-associated protein Cmr4